LLDWATEHRALLRVEQSVGAFVGEQVLLFQARLESPSAGPVAPEALADLPQCLVVARHRSIEQDAAFGIQQLVDIALKALSAGINDTTTAIMAVDHLGLVCQRLAGQAFPPRLRSDGERPRVLVPAPDFAGYLRLAFDLVRINAKGNHAVLQCLLRALALTGEAARTPERKMEVDAQARLLLSHAEQTLATEYEKLAVRLLYAECSPCWLATGPV